MSAKKDSIERILKDFLGPRHASAVRLLEAVQLEVLDEFASDEDQPCRIALDATVQSASRLAARRTPEHPLDQSHARKSLWELFQRLGAAGYGKIRKGRRGHPTRFEFGTQLTCGDLRRVLDELGVRSTAHDGSVVAARQDASPAQSAAHPGKGLERDAVVALLKQHEAELHQIGVSSLSLFGSVARNEARPDSDVDLVVSFTEPVTSAGFFATKFFLEDLLGRRVDLLTESSLREQVRRAIEPELVRVA